MIEIMTGGPPSFRKYSTIETFPRKFTKHQKICRPPLIAWESNLETDILWTANACNWMIWDWRTKPTNLPRRKICVPPRPPNFQGNHQMSTCTTHGKGTTDKNVQNALEIMRPCSLSPACSEGNNMNNVAASTNIKQASRQKPCLIYLCLVPETYTHLQHPYLFLESLKIEARLAQINGRNFNDLSPFCCAW